MPLPAGSTSDAVARLIAEPLRESLGHAVVVENRPGATGRIAAEAFVRAAPDGATLLLTPIAVPVINPLVFKDPGYDPARDFAPLAQVARYEFALAVAPGHPARTVPEFVAWAKSNPAHADFGTAGAGSLPHFLGTMLGRAGGVGLTHVAYKGAVQMEGELIGGQIAAGIGALSDLLALHRAGRLRILATSGARRSPFLPDVPTFAEQGFPEVEANGWHALYAPAGTPQATLERLSAAIGAALRAPAMRSRFAALGLEPTGTTPQALSAIMAADTAHWRPIIKASGFDPGQ